MKCRSFAALSNSPSRRCTGTRAALLRDCEHCGSQPSPHQAIAPAEMQDDGCPRSGVDTCVPWHATAQHAPSPSPRVVHGAQRSLRSLGCVAAAAAALDQCLTQHTARRQPGHARLPTRALPGSCRGIWHVQDCIVSHCAVLATSVMRCAAADRPHIHHQDLLRRDRPRRAASVRTAATSASLEVAASAKRGLGASGGLYKQLTHALGSEEVEEGG